jgi:hypothetical protein
MSSFFANELVMNDEASIANQTNAISNTPLSMTDKIEILAPPTVMAALSNADCALGNRPRM